MPSVGDGGGGGGAGGGLSVAGGCVVGGFVDGWVGDSPHAATARQITKMAHTPAP